MENFTRSMNVTLPKKELIIAIVEKGNEVLMRKKPEGSLPYKETWYSFGCERVHSQKDSETLKEYLKKEVGVEVEISEEPIFFATEIKQDHDGIEKEFDYINLRCTYLEGKPRPPKGAERISWISKDNLAEYDIVPPSVELFKKLGWLK